MKETKECTECHALKPIDEFALNGKTSKGKQKIRGKCKVCDAKRVKKYRRGDPFIRKILKCGSCSKTSPIWIYTSNEDGTYVYLCEVCTKLRLEKKK